MARLYAPRVPCRHPLLQRTKDTSREKLILKLVGEWNPFSLGKRWPVVADVALVVGEVDGGDRLSVHAVVVVFGVVGGG